MARYRTTDAAAGQGIFISVNLSEQLLPGSFEHMLNEIIGTKIDLSIFDKKYKNDLVGARAVPPAALLKLVIYGYLNGCISSRKIYELNENNIIAKALTGDMYMHWTTIAAFISGNKEAFEKVFLQVLMYCNELELIGGKDFAIDGLRLPSNASMEMSGTEEQLKKRLEVCKRMAVNHIERHKRKDAKGAVDEDTKRRFEERQKKINRKVENISAFMETMEKKVGRKKEEIQSNVTDNESAIIRCSTGFTQGYIGIAVVDQESQVITSTQAVGSSNEAEYLPLLLDSNTENLKEAGVEEPAEGRQRMILGDSAYLSEENIQACEARGVEPVIACGRPSQSTDNEEKKYGPDDFTYNETEDCYTCPQGKRLEYKRKPKLEKGGAKEYRAALNDCRQCSAFSQCMRSRKAQSDISRGKSILKKEAESLCSKMRKKMETVEYKDIYAYRIQIVEPVFANIRHCKGLNRFTLRGKAKVNSQWLLYCMVHNLGKCLNGRAVINAA